MLTLNNLTYTFNKTGVCAVDSVSLTLKPGSIVGILGENGAGKSTLAKLCTGRLYSSDGEIDGEIKGEFFLSDSLEDKSKKLIKIQNTENAIKLGLVLVEQDPKIANDLKVWENLIIGYNKIQNISDYKFLSPKKIIHFLETSLRKYNIFLPLNETASKLDLANIYMTVIGEALLKQPKYLFLDEATAHFSQQEVKNFYSTLRKYADEGNCVIVITHKLEEILNYADSFFILNQGKLIKTGEVTKDIKEDDLINYIFENENLGKITKEKKEFLAKLNLDYPEKKQNSVIDDITNSNKKNIEVNQKFSCLKISNLSVFGNYGKYSRSVYKLNLEAMQGKITGIIGIKNQGIEALEDILAGIIKPNNGSITFNGKPLKKLSRNEWGYIPSKRIKRGIAPNQNILTNIISRVRYFLYKHNFYSKNKLKEWTCNSKFDLEKPLNEYVLALSGGMLQKLIFNRELDNPNPKLLICAEPYFGLDQKVQFELFKRLKLLAKKGSTIIILSSDADMAMEICDSIFVIYGGEISLSVKAQDYDDYENCDNCNNCKDCENDLKNRFNRMQILSAMLKKQNNSLKNGDVNGAINETI